MTDRTTSMLSDLDDRLARLEKSLVPIHQQTGKLTRVSKSAFKHNGMMDVHVADLMEMPLDIEATIRSIDGLLGHHDLVERESPLILAG